MIGPLRCIFWDRLTNWFSSVRERNTTLNFRESDMSLSPQNAPVSGQADCSLERDESRFRYFSPNGKPVIRANPAPHLTVKTSYELAHAIGGA